MLQYFYIYLTFGYKFVHTHTVILSNAVQRCLTCACCFTSVSKHETLLQGFEKEQKEGGMFWNNILLCPLYTVLFLSFLHRMRGYATTETHSDVWNEALCSCLSQSPSFSHVQCSLLRRNIIRLSAVLLPIQDVHWDVNRQ